VAVWVGAALQMITLAGWVQMICQDVGAALTMRRLKRCESDTARASTVSARTMLTGSATSVATTPTARCVTSRQDATPSLTIWEAIQPSHSASSSIESRSRSTVTSTRRRLTTRL